MTDSNSDGIGFRVYRTTDGGRSWSMSVLPVPTDLH
jgi:hypothetical protein